MEHFIQTARVEAIAQAAMTDNPYDNDIFGGWYVANIELNSEWQALLDDGHSGESIADAWNRAGQAVYRAIYGVTMK